MWCVFIYWYCETHRTIATPLYPKCCNWSPDTSAHRITQRLVLSANCIQCQFGKIRVCIAALHSLLLRSVKTELLSRSENWGVHTQLLYQFWAGVRDLCKICCAEIRDHAFVRKMIFVGRKIETEEVKPLFSLSLKLSVLPPTSKLLGIWGGKETKLTFWWRQYILDWYHPLCSIEESRDKVMWRWWWRPEELEPLLGAFFFLTL